MTETYTIQDIAGMTGLNERTIRSYLADGLLKGEKTDGAWRFTAEQFGDFLRQDDEKDTGKGYKIDALHKMVDSQELASIPLKLESSGTLKMFALYPSLKDVLDHGGTLFVDELNARLHPLLVRNIILTFLSPEINTQNAQLIFATHDVWQFSNELLRRDEIWLVNKNRDGVSELYSLADFKDEEGNKVRRDEALSKKYLTGIYGAIPALKPMEMLTGRTLDDE